MSFEEIYQTYWDKVYRLCKGYVNDSDWAQDIAQETFLTVWRQLSAFRQEATIGTWIFRIACNNCLRQIERNNRFRKNDFPAQLPDIPAPDYNAELAYLQQCISELPETDRLIISMELEEVPQAQIAAILGLSAGNVRIRLHRIREKLKEKFETYEHS